MSEGALAWATAIGTLAAAAVPAILWFFERRDRKDAEAQLRAREAADRARATERQSREVFVWKVWAHYGDDREGVRMLNTANLPIFDVCLYGYGAKAKRQSLDEDGYLYVVVPATVSAHRPRVQSSTMCG